MSMQHSVASVLVRKGASDENFFDYDNPAVGAVTGKVAVAGSPAFNRLFPRQQAATVKVALSDGNTFSSTVEDVPSFEEDGVVLRYRTVARKVLSEHQVDGVETLVRNCATLDDVRPILGELRAACSLSASASINKMSATAPRAAISPS
jgi:2-methylcitrate dehydratase PrpD